jgi:hypothetical protein
MNTPSSAWVVLIFVGLSLPGCTRYSAAPIVARVVDAETGQPVVGANVLVTWELENHFGGLEERGRGLMTQLEAVTDTEGRFRIPAWGPQIIPVREPPFSMLSPSQPAIRVFKSGYAITVVQNENSGAYLQDFFYKGPSKRSSDWDGKAISLKPLPKLVNGTDWMFPLSPDFSNVMIFECRWKSMPHFLAALVSERARIRRDFPSAVGVNLPDLEQIDQWGGKGRCGSASRVLGISK